MDRDQVTETAIVKVSNLIKEHDPGYLFGPTDTITWTDQVKGYKAGICWPARQKIGLNPEIPDEHLETTIAHEVCHIYAYDQGEKGHGKKWKDIMKKIGYPPERCHKYDLTPARKETRYKYTCGCRVHSVPTRTHNKVMRSQMLYSCKYCKQVLQFTGEEA